MQFYTNGFHAGDPTVASTRESEKQAGNNAIPTTVDALIVGCGPAGLLLAAQLSQFDDITTCIVEAKSGPLEIGQADGFSGRSLEIFQSFGLAHRVMHEAYQLQAISFWRFDDNNPSTVVRQSKQKDGRGIYSEFPHVVLNQARVHRFLLDKMRDSPANLEPCYNTRLTAIEQYPGDAFPVHASVMQRHPDGTEAEQRIRARLIIGCDGAHSSVRKSQGLSLDGDATNKAWGVMDLLVITDFPDIRIKSIVQSAHEGNVMFIPREGGNLVRVYVELEALSTGHRITKTDHSPEALIDAVNRIIHPYRLNVQQVAWWSVYEIGQRVCPIFDNRQSTPDHIPTVLIAGDACHTHSPKAGQGMNISMHDAFNLGWKVAAVLRGQARPELLLTYSDERQTLATELIEFDRELAAVFSRPVEQTREDSAQTRLQATLIKADAYVSGTLCTYPPSIIVADSPHGSLASGFSVGSRFHSSPVVRLADACPMQLGHALVADGRWRLVLFADAAHPASGDSALRALTEYLDTPIRRYTPAGADIDSVIEILSVFQQPYTAIEFADLPALLWPAHGCLRLRDYEKTFCVDHERTNIYAERGINQQSGCILIVRPDQHVAHVLPLTAREEITSFFDAVLVSSQLRL